jgi:DNA-directed RNA polymerase specialized sigma24 family protein
MPTAEEFDEFYVSTRRGLVLQTFALTGDLAASRSAVRDAYVAARHHWAKVGKDADPEAWVRPRALSAAQRRHTARPWHKERQVDEEQARTLEALHGLTDYQRRTLVLTHLSALSTEQIAREVALPLERAGEVFDEATGAVAEALGCAREQIGPRLDDLGTVADSVKLPRPSIVRRNGLRRRRNFAAIGGALIAATTVLAGSFVVVGSPAAPAPAAVTLVSKRMLLTPQQLAPLTPTQIWQEVSTGDNTGGNGKNNVCQTSRFADDAGLGTWVRKFTATGTPTRNLVQTVEISNSPGAARTAYGITLGWYAGCTVARLQLVDAYQVSGVGDEAQVLRLRIPAKQDRVFVVGIARTGALTTSTVLETSASKPMAAGRVAATLAASVRDLCSSKVAGACVSTVRTAASLPPPSGEAKGMLAVADLPAIAKVDQAWVGTDASAATTNPAATPCDKANFVKDGGKKALTRSFLIPEGKLPQRFGLTETIATFSSAPVAEAFVGKIVRKMKACPHNELGSTVTSTLVQRSGPGATAYARWRLESQVNKKNFEIDYWMGIARVGNAVAQVNFTPVDSYDISREQFTALLVRARDRLHEVSR